jgi:hypothetical protein
MKVEIKKRAQNSLEKVVEWIIAQQFLDTGLKWLDDFEDTVEHMAKTGVKYAICKDESLAKYEYRCFTYKQKWVVAYKITATKITIYRFILGSRLK